jgi:hypothetical protein
MAVVDDPRLLDRDRALAGTRLASGRREATSNQGGTTEGVFVSEWRGDVLFGSNEAVGGEYILAYATSRPGRPDRTAGTRTNPALARQLPPRRRPAVLPARSRAVSRAARASRRRREAGDFICFRFDGRQGVYVHPNVWHEGVFGVRGAQRFFDKQGAVHAEVSLDFAREFGCLLEAPVTNFPYLLKASTGSIPATSARRISLSVATTSSVLATTSSASARGITTTPSRSPSGSNHRS